MRELLICFIILFSTEVSAQKEKTFMIEELTPPKNFLPEGYISDRSPFEILATSVNETDPFVNIFGYHSFFNGMYYAYAEHRPFVLSPDMIWLLISQGFARHIHADPEKYRHIFTNESEKIKLIVDFNEVKDITNRRAWEKVLPKFTGKIAVHTGKEFINLLKADFSTTTITEQIASEITILEAMEPYFEYVAMKAVCGIPEITLKGTKKDWQKVLDKTIRLGSHTEYDLEWWIAELIPLLKEFINASEGKIDKVFWRNMFKYHSAEEYGAPNIIDGWIVKFFPYDRYGKRNKLDEIHGTDNLPDEMVAVDLLYIETDPFTNTQISRELELCAGFIGLEQNRNNYALTPKIGWLIREKQNREEQQKSTINANNANDGTYVINEVPDEIMELKDLSSLYLQFTDSIKIPEKMKNMGIKRLSLTGKIDMEEIEKINQMLTGTDVTIYTTLYSGAKLTVYSENLNVTTTKGNEVPQEITQLNNYKNLSINFQDQVSIPEWITSLEINKLAVSGKTSPNEINRIIEKFPDMDLTINRTFPERGNWRIEYSNGKVEVRTTIENVSDEMMELGNIYKLDIFFPSEVDFSIPDWYRKLNLKELVIGGRTGKCMIDIESVKKILPDLTYLRIGDETLIGTSPK